MPSSSSHQPGISPVGDPSSLPQRSATQHVGTAPPAHTAAAAVPVGPSLHAAQSSWQDTNVSSKQSHDQPHEQLKHWPPQTQTAAAAAAHPAPVQLQQQQQQPMAPTGPLAPTREPLRPLAGAPQRSDVLKSVPGAAPVPQPKQALSAAAAATGKQPVQSQPMGPPPAVQRSQQQHVAQSAHAQQPQQPQQHAAQPSDTEQQQPSSEKQLPAVRQSRPREDAQTVYVQGVRYAKLECVGRGGSSKVFKVMGPGCKIYALKRIRLAGRDAEAASGFIDEIALLEVLRHKPNIIQLIDSQARQTRHAMLCRAQTACCAALTSIP